MKKKQITIICPVYNEEVTIPLFYTKIIAIIEKLKKYDFRILFTNNNSNDKSLEVIQNLCKVDKRISYLTFSKNFGYQASLLGGLKHSKGDAFVFIDVDCEDPPYLILEFVKHWENGFDIVYGLRGKRAEPKWITVFRKLFYRILRFVADTEIILDMAEFSLISLRVKDEIINNSNTFPFLRAEIAYSGFKKIGVKYDRQPRIAGKSNYNLLRMALFGLGGILSVSTFPLRLGILILPIVIIMNLILLILDFGFNLEKAFKLLVCMDLIFLMTIISFHGIYIARIYKNGISRPVFIIDWMRSKIS
ncbi:MAG: glycosyltransferase family 2 protein [Leptospiraceae bacterium]|nr:glycosyltransferase family 2 protein [Leptospiraceae bacterium]